MEILQSSSRMAQFINMPLLDLDDDMFLDSIQPTFDLIPRDQLDHEDSLFSTLLHEPSPESTSTGDLKLLHSLSDILMSQGEGDLATPMQGNGPPESSIGGTISHVNMPPTQHSDTKDVWKSPKFLSESSASPIDLGLDLGYIHTQFHSQNGTPESSSCVLPFLEAEQLDNNGFSPCVNEAAMAAVAEAKHMDSDADNYSDATEDTEQRGKWGGSGKASISKNLVSERRRRKKLNERLYSLRAIVPKISKMDKASIVGDAINYVQDLQKQVEDIKTEIANLEVNIESTSTITTTTIANSNTIVDLPSLVYKSQEMQDHKILELEVSKMEEETYHIRIHCKKGPGVLVQLSWAIEALNFEIINCNLTSFDDRVLNTIIVKVQNNVGMSKAEHVKRMVLDVVPKFRLHL